MDRRMLQQGDLAGRPRVARTYDLRRLVSSNAEAGLA